MATYRANYSARYRTPSLLEQTEVATIKAAQDINNEDPGTPNHANRLKWAEYVNRSSSVAAEVFKWPVSLNPSIAAAVEADPSGGTVLDGDVQFVVNSNVDKAVAEYTASQTP